MLKKFMDWWKQNPNAELVEVFDYDVDYKGSHKIVIEEEYRYETTLVRDLDKIANLLGKRFPYDKPYKISGTNLLRFRTEGESVKEVTNKIELKSLTIHEDMTNIGVIYWEIDVKEYRRVYESNFVEFADAVRELLKFVKKNFDNSDYFYTFCKYEDSVHIVADTLKDELDNGDGEIGDAVFQKAKAILSRCAHAINNKKDEIEYIEELQREAVRKSLENRLEEELDFMNNYIETN